METAGILACAVISAGAASRVTASGLKPDSSLGRPAFTILFLDLASINAREGDAVLAVDVNGMAASAFRERCPVPGVMLDIRGHHVFCTVEVAPGRLSAASDDARAAATPPGLSRRLC